MDIIYLIKIKTNVEGESRPLWYNLDYKKVILRFEKDLFKQGKSTDKRWTKC